MKWNDWRHQLPTLWPYLRRYKGLGVLSIVLMVVSSFTGLLSPLPLAFVLDCVFGNEDPPGFVKSLVGTDKNSLILFAMAAMLVIGIVPYALSIADNYINTRLDQYVALDFQSDLYRHCQRLSQSYYDDKSSGDFIYRINTEARAAGALLVSIPPFGQSLITLVVTFAIAVQIDAELVLLSMIVVPFVLASTKYYSTRIEPHLVRTRNIEGDLLNIVSESMRMLPVVTSFNRQGHEFRRFRGRGDEAVDARLKVTLRQTMFSLVTALITGIGAAATLGLGARHVVDGTLTVGALFVVINYIRQIYEPLRSFAPTMAAFQEMFISLRFARELLATEPEVTARPGAQPIGRARGEVVLEHVDFSYAGREHTLRDISFNAKPGERIAIVGPTGAGKTTLINLLPRFRELSAGRILLDGIDTRDITVESLRDQISFVQQEPLLFRSTIGENIRYGRLEASDEDVVSAAKSANAHDFISALPDGYDTALGERGGKISGGERQRIAIARAFMKNAPIIVLDEPTSAIDSRTEAVILDALDRLMEGRTTFMIAHRLSTIRDADQILVLQHGEIVERGTHEELIRQDGLYSQLHEMQNRQASRRGSRATTNGHAEGSPTPAPIQAELDSGLIEDIVREQLAAVCLTDEDPRTLDPDDDLLESGALDTAAIAQLVSFFESDLGVTLDDHEVVDEHFRTVRAIVDLVGGQHRTAAEDAWTATVRDFRELVADATPAGSTVLVANRGDEGLLRFDGRTGWHFPRTDGGEAAGYHPADGAEALAHVRALESLGASHIAFPSTELWWLDHYRELTDHLEAVGGRVAGTAGVLYALR